MAASRPRCVAAGCVRIAHPVAPPLFHACVCVRARTLAGQVEPKKKKLVEAQERLDRTMADLNVAKQRLRDVLDRIADLEDQFTATQVLHCLMA